MPGMCVRQRTLRLEQLTPLCPGVFLCLGRSLVVRLGLAVRVRVSIVQNHELLRTLCHPFLREVPLTLLDRYLHPQATKVGHLALAVVVQMRRLRISADDPIRWSTAFRAIIAPSQRRNWDFRCTDRSNCSYTRKNNAENRALCSAV